MTAFAPFLEEVALENVAVERQAVLKAVRVNDEGIPFVPRRTKADQSCGSGHGNRVLSSGVMGPLKR